MTVPLADATASGGERRLLLRSSAGIRPSTIRRELRRRWGLVLFCVTLGIAAGAAISHLRTVRYQAAAVTYVGEVHNKFLSPLLVKSYADAAASTNALTHVSRPISPQLNSALDGSAFGVTVPANTTLVKFGIQGSTVRQANARVRAITAAFRELVTHSSHRAVRDVNVSYAVGPVPRHLPATAFIGGLVGLLGASLMMAVLAGSAPMSRRKALQGATSPEARRLVNRARFMAAGLMIIAVILTLASGRSAFVALAGGILVLGLLMCIRLAYLPICALFAFALVPEARLPYHGTASPAIVIVVVLFVRVLVSDRSIGRGPHVIPLIGLSAWMADRALFSSSVSTSGAWLVAFVGLVVLPSLVLPGWEEAQEHVESAWLGVGGALGVYSLVELTLHHNPLSALYGDTGLAADTVYRVTTTLGNPLLTGLFFCIAVFIGVGHLLRRVTPWRLAATVLSTVGMFATSSRGSALALGVGLALLIILRLRSDHLPQLRRTVALVAVVIAGLVGGTLYLSQRADSTEASGSTTVRLETYQAGGYLVRDFWRWGAGPGLTDEIKYQMPYGNYQRGVESSAFEVLIELGLPGTVLFCWVLLSAAGSSIRRRPELTAAVLAFAISSSTFDLLDEFRPSLILLGLLIGVAASPCGEEPRPHPSSKIVPAGATAPAV